jgi:hypothetical protein
MPKFICTKRCYRGGRVYKVGDTWIPEQGRPLPPEFKPEAEVLRKAELMDADSLYDMQQRNRPRGPRNIEEDRVRSSLGHRHPRTGRAPEEDPFVEPQTTADDQDNFL